MTTTTRTTTLSPFLHFTGEAADAVAHYAAVLGGELNSQTYGEFGMGDDPRDADLVMHAQLDFGAGTLMASDVPHAMRGDVSTAGTQVCLWGTDEEVLRGWFDGLAQGGQVLVPLERAPWGDAFGQLRDRFGVTWMVNVSAS
jgi:PhnB protein